MTSFYLFIISDIAIKYLLKEKNMIFLCCLAMSINHFKKDNRELSVFWYFCFATKRWVAWVNSRFKTIVRWNIETINAWQSSAPADTSQHNFLKIKPNIPKHCSCSLVSSFCNCSFTMHLSKQNTLWLVLTAKVDSKNSIGCILSIFINNYDHFSHQINIITKWPLRSHLSFYWPWVGHSWLWSYKWIRSINSPV